MSKYPRKHNVRLFKEFEAREIQQGRRFQTNWELLHDMHTDKFDT